MANFTPSIIQLVPAINFNYGFTFLLQKYLLFSRVKFFKRKRLKVLSRRVVNWPLFLDQRKSGNMARQQTTERNIPHLRDIFGFGSKWDNSRILTEEKAPGHDSAISVGSTSGEEESPKNNKKKKSRRRDNSKTLTESDVKHLERHLSMKKTIRKKIMRDLQQAFVEDPNEFRVDDIPPEQLKAEINVQSLSFGTPSQKQGRPRGNAESTFLDMLRSGGGTFLNYITIIINRFLQKLTIHLYHIKYKSLRPWINTTL